MDRAIQVTLSRLLVAWCLSVSVACDLYAERRVLPGGYRLERFDADTFFVESGAGISDPGGILEGRAVEIGWSDEFIVAKRIATVGGATEWFAIDLRSRRVSGPFNASQWTEVREKRPELGRINVAGVGDVWDRLK